MGALRIGPSSVPSHASQDQAVESLLARGYSACEIEFGHAERGGAQAPHGDGMLDYSAGIAAACGGHPSRRRLDS